MKTKIINEYNRVEKLARFLHDSYEEIASDKGWDTQNECKTTFKDLPIKNKQTMIALAGRLLNTNKLESFSIGEVKMVWNAAIKCFHEGFSEYTFNEIINEVKLDRFKKIDDDWLVLVGFDKVVKTSPMNNGKEFYIFRKGDLTFNPSQGLWFLKETPINFNYEYRHQISLLWNALTGLELPTGAQEKLF